MNARLEKWATRFDALALRERVLVFAAAALVFGFLAFKFVLEPQVLNSRRLSHVIVDQNVQLSALQTQIKALEMARLVDLDSANRDRLQKAQEQLSQLEVELGAAQKGLVSAELMPSLLQDVLRQYHGLELIELRTLPVKSLIDHPAPKDDKTPKPPGTAVVSMPDAKTAGSERNLYQHGFELTVRGSYPDFVQYLARLEKLPMRMYWGKVTMNADDYPRVTLTATIYTLSLDKSWLAV